MITAKKAREMTQEAVQNGDDFIQTMKSIEERIKNAAQSGKRSISYFIISTDLWLKAREELSEQGFRISEKHVYKTISW